MNPIYRISKRIVGCTMALSLLVSCGEDRWKEFESQTSLDTWIHQVLAEHYLWKEHLISYRKANLFLPPSSFLSAVKAKPDKYSFVDSLLSTPRLSYGFAYTLVKQPQQDTLYHALVTEVYPHSPAELAGLQRGHWILGVNGQSLSTYTEKKWFQGNRQLQLSLGHWQEETITAPDGTETVKGKVVHLNRDIQVGVPTSVPTSPIAAHRIFSLAGVGAVGYLKYDRFLTGTPEQPTLYDQALRNLSQTFKQAHIQALIIDLRHNQGGDTESLQLLATLVAPAQRLGTTFAYLQYGNEPSSRDKELRLDPSVIGNGVNLDLPLLVFLTSNQTAGAAEMLIAGFHSEAGSPQLLTIGEKTQGSPVGLERFANPIQRWQLHLATHRLLLSDKQHTFGPITPAEAFIQKEYYLQDKTDYSRVRPYGDAEEHLLYIALQTLSGNYPPAATP